MGACDRDDGSGRLACQGGVWILEVSISLLIYFNRGCKLLIEGGKCKDES